jgi:hypothetical protein
MTKKAARLSHPDIALNRLLARGAGRPRAEAIAAAAVRLTAQQAMAMTAIGALIAGLETQSEDLARVGRDADRIITLAEPFGLAPLADAARRLCDLAAMLRARGRHAPDALTVHIQALRLFAPGSPALDDADAALVLGRIAALASHVSSPLSGR